MLNKGVTKTYRVHFVAQNGCSFTTNIQTYNLKLAQKQAQQMKIDCFADHKTIKTIVKYKIQKN